MAAFWRAALTCCCNTDEAIFGGKGIIDVIIGPVITWCNWFSCNAEAGTWIVSTRGSEFGIFGCTGKVIWMGTILFGSKAATPVGTGVGVVVVWAANGLLLLPLLLFVFPFWIWFEFWLILCFCSCVLLAAAAAAAAAFAAFAAAVVAALLAARLPFLVVVCNEMCGKKRKHQVKHHMDLQAGIDWLVKYLFYLQTLSNYILYLGIRVWLQGE
jgi:hypothetical protein